MTERENLPTKFAVQGLATSVEKRGSLVARGMAVLKMDNDALYRQARAVFDRRGRDSIRVFDRRGRDSIRNWNRDVAENPALSSAFKTFQRLADENYGKAYYPLSILYGGKRNIEEGKNHAQHFAQLAFDWCFANQANQDAELWCDLGDMYIHGCGVAEDYKQAEYWFRMAAELGYSRGQWRLGESLLINDGGFDWMELAAKQGNAFDQTWLANYYECFLQQYQKAAYWFRMAAEQGDGCGQFNLGRMYKQGLGVDQNDEQAVYWIRKAAEQSYEPGQKELGYMYSEGRGVAQDYAQAEYWFRKADWPPCEIGVVYKEGWHGVPQDDKQVIYWFNKAAEQGDEDGQWELGGMFANGRGVAQDNEQAKYWFRKATEQLGPIFQNELGYMYREGRDVSQDDKQAVYWFTKAAEQGDEDGQFSLGEMYRGGFGVEKSDEQAVHWFHKAADQGNADALEALKILGVDWKK